MEFRVGGRKFYVKDMADGEGEEELVLDSLDMLLASAYAVQTIFKPGNQAPASSTTTTPAPVSFDWQQFNAIIAELSKQCTNIAMMFDGNTKPKGKDAVALCEKLQTPLIALAHFLHNGLPIAPQIIGKAGAEQLRDFASRLADSVVKFIVSVKSPDNHGRLRQTGVVWEHCDTAPHLARDAASAGVIVVDRQTGMVRDVVEELQSTAEATADEKQSAVVIAVLGMVKCVLAVLSKLKSALDERGGNKTIGDSVKAVDEMTAQMELLSSTVDDLVVEMYGVQEELGEAADAVDADSLNSAADLLSTRLSQLLASFAASVFFEPTADGQRLEFLTKAIEHNRSKLQRSMNNIST